MKRKMIGVSFGAIALGCMVYLIIGMTTADAKNYGFKNYHLWGDYASQLTGTFNYPVGHPFEFLNGPFCLQGRVSADGKGNAWGTVYENYNGMLFHYSWEGIYDVNPDGTLLLEGDYELLGIPLHFEMFGVLCDKGNRVRMMHVGPIPGDDPDSNMLFTTITGSWIRQ